MLPDVLPEPPGLEEPLVPDEPPSPAPAPPDALPELPASELGALPHDAVLVQSSALLLQADTCKLAKPTPRANAEKAVMRRVVAVVPGAMLPLLQSKSQIRSDVPIQNVLEALERAR
jgi:hypothetical protein